MNRTRIFSIDDCTFCFCKHGAIRSLAEYEPDYELLIHDTDLQCYRTIGYPRNITEAKKMAKDYLLYA